MTMIALRSCDSAHRATANMPWVCMFTRTSVVTRGSTGAPLSRTTTTASLPRAARIECAAASASGASVDGSASTRYQVRPLTSATRTYASHPARSSESRFATAVAVSGYEASCKAITAPVTAGDGVANVSAAALSLSVRAPSRSPQATSTASAPSALSALSAFALGIRPLDRTLRDRHPPLPAVERFLLSPLDFGLDLRLDVAERRARHAFVHEILLVERDGIAPPPLREELGVERVARLGFVMRGVSAHAERLGHQQRRSFAPTAAFDGEGRDPVRIEHVIPVELPAPHPVRARPIRKARAGRGQVMLLEAGAERHLIVLDDEDGWRATDGGEVEPFVRDPRLGAPVPDPRHRDLPRATDGERERDAGNDRHHVANVTDRRDHAVLERAVVPISPPRRAVGRAHIRAKGVGDGHAHLRTCTAVSYHWGDDVVLRTANCELRTRSLGTFRCSQFAVRSSQSS